MTAGCRIYAPDHTLVVDITDRITMLQGSFNTGTSPGSYAPAVLDGQSVWFHCRNYVDGNSVTQRGPNVYLDGNVIRWDFNGGGSPAAIDVTFGTW